MSTHTQLELLPDPVAYVVVCDECVSSREFDSYEQAAEARDEHAWLCPGSDPWVSPIWPVGWEA